VASDDDPAVRRNGGDQKRASGVGITTYYEALETRIAELLRECHDDRERGTMMREIEKAALEAGICTTPSPDPANPSHWTLDLVSGDPAMKSLLQNKCTFEWMPDPESLETLDEFVSALRPTRSFD
jgi:hypothetical protein